VSILAIRAEGVGKRYAIGAPRAPYGSLRETVTQALTAPFRRRARGRSVPESDTLWALQDVSFDVRPGEVVGVIGRNGAGKSTLLKILARITEPTTGQVVLSGRVGSLLEIGTGFHSELTGRENLFLNGAILGMRRVEIQRKFDEIVAFAEIERFLDTPVKHYSTGMYLRLAFAVAAHLEPEILLVDEVLAVGDAAFQRKCLGKMGDVARTGRTILFVSHNMGAVTSICEKGIVLEAGRVVFSGPAIEAATVYLNQFSGAAEPRVAERRDRTGSGEVRLTDFGIQSAKGERLEAIRNGEAVRLVFEYETRDGQSARNVEFQIVVRTEAGDLLFQFGSRFLGRRLDRIPGAGSLVCEIRRFPLVPGRYRLDAFVVADGVPSDFILWVAPLTVVDGDFYGSGYRVFERESRFLIDGDVGCEARAGDGGDGRS